MKKGIIIVSFGTSYISARKRCIESIEKRFEEAFPEYEVRRAFTSNIIIKKLKARDHEQVLTPREALEKMIADGYDSIHVQPLHVIPGYEYEKAAAAVRYANHCKEVKVTLGQPLLAMESHYDEVVEALLARLPAEAEHQGVVLMGHGTAHHANACYTMLQAKLTEVRPDIHIANVEGYPELDHIMDRLKAYDAVTLMPLMIVAGDHAQNDMAGEEENSYRSLLQAEGIEVTAWVEGLGENPLIQQAFLNRAKAAVVNDWAKTGKEQI